MRISINVPGNSVLVGALVPIGSRNEDEKYKGISHFLEHMMFKGTKNRTRSQIVNEVEKYGATFNAYTSLECTFYYIEISKKYVNVARSIISDMMDNSILPTNELNKERNVILQELQMYEDNPGSAIYEVANKVVYKKDSGLYSPVIGSRESIDRINRNVMKKYYDKHYTKPIMIEVGAVNDNYRNPTIISQFNNEVPSDEKELIIQRDGINQSNILLTGIFNVLDQTVLTDFGLTIFSSAMNGFTGRLFNTIREKYNMVYRIGFDYEILSCGTVQYYISAALDHNNIPKAREIILNELTKPLSKTEIEFSANKWLGKYDLNNNVSTKARTLIDSIIKGQSYDDYSLFNENNIIKAKNHVNDIITQADFRNTSKFVAIVPKGN